MLIREELIEKCPYAASQKALSGKWAVIVLQELSQGTRRFGELQRAFPDLTQATLTKQLRQLEKDGLVCRKVYAEVPPKVEYYLAPMGEEFRPVLESLEHWGQKYIRFLKKRK